MELYLDAEISSIFVANSILGTIWNLNKIIAEELNIVNIWQHWKVGVKNTAELSKDKCYPVFWEFFFLNGYKKTLRFFWRGNWKSTQVSSVKK